VVQRSLHCETPAIIENNIITPNSSIFLQKFITPVNTKTSGKSAPHAVTTARVLTSMECIIKEKQMKKKTEEEEKQRRKREKERKAEEEKQRKVQQKAQKVPERAEKAKKAEEDPRRNYVKPLKAQHIH